MQSALDPSQWWQYGAIGGLSCVLLGLFVWIVVKLVNRLLVHFDELRDFLHSSTKALNSLTDGQVQAAHQHDDITVKLNDIARRRGF